MVLGHKVCIGIFLSEIGTSDIGIFHCRIEYNDFVLDPLRGEPSDFVDECKGFTLKKLKLG